MSAAAHRRRMLCSPSTPALPCPLRSTDALGPLDGLDGLDPPAARRPVAPTDRRMSVGLDREWAKLRRAPAAVRRARSWALTPTPFADLDELLVLAGHRVPSTPATEVVLHRLATLAPTHDLAARILLQRILPGLLALTAVEQRRDPAVDAFEDLAANAWIAIRRYRADRRRDAIPARLLNDARDLTFTRPRRRATDVVVPCPPDRCPEPPAPDAHPFAELVAVLGEARSAGLRDADLATVRCLLDHDSVVDAATADRMSTRAMRYRRRDAVARIRTLTGERRPRTLALAH